MSDDRDYWRRQDELREERQREYRREEFRREDERRLDWEREDREYEARQREENQRRAMEEMRRGNTAWALNYMVGPDAAIGYLEAMQQPYRDEPEADAASDDEAEPSWPPYSFVTTTAELLVNVSSAPSDVSLHAVRIDNDGDALVEARREPAPFLAALEALAGEMTDHPLSEPGRFWVARRCSTRSPPRPRCSGAPPSWRPPSNS